MERTAMVAGPDVGTLTTSPVRNRLRVELDAPVEEVWSLLGDLSRYPEYSMGLEKVEAELDSTGSVAAYVCHFAPQEEGGEVIRHQEFMRWYEPNRGYASAAEAGNAFGLTNAVTLVTVEPSGRGTRMTWRQHYDAQDMGTMKAVFADALADIGENLVGRFGGRIAELFVE